MKVAFLGLGRMGAPMAMRVVRAGHDVTVWNRTPGKADEVVAAGARETSSPADACLDAEVAVTMLSGPDAVRTVVLGPEGARAGLPAGSLLVDASTVGPKFTRALEAELLSSRHRFADAPVAGSVQPATDGTLAVLVGAHDEDWADVRDVVSLWGDPAKIRHVGPVGAGSAMKLVLNLSLGGVMGAVGEALRLGTDLGLPVDDVLDVLELGPLGFTVRQKRPMIRSNEYQPVNFSLDLLVKDLDLCVGTSHRDLPITSTVLDVARQASSTGKGNDDYSALVGYLAHE